MSEENKITRVVELVGDDKAIFRTEVEMSRDGLKKELLNQLKIKKQSESTIKSYLSHINQYQVAIENVKKNIEVYDGLISAIEKALDPKEVEEVNLEFSNFNERLGHKVDATEVEQE